MTTPSNVVQIPLWKQLVNRNEDGKIEPTIGAILSILTHDNDVPWRGCFTHDTFADQTMIAQPLPKTPDLIAPAPGPLNDSHVTYVRTALKFHNRINIGREMAFEAIIGAAHQREYHPLRDYLSSLAWDGQPRIDEWLTTYLGAEATEYSRAVGRWFLMSAIARAFRPGCQADHMLVLEGKQGAAKSSAVGILGGEFTLHKLPSLRDESRAAHSLLGHWIVEVAELDAFRGAAASQIKDFVSLRRDTYRAPYARMPVTHDRSCVFIGTTNEEHYLRDATGARRPWPVRVGVVSPIDRAGLIRDRDQLFAEAKAAYESGASYQDIDRPPETRWWPPHEDFGASLRASLASEQEERQESQIDPWREIIVAWIQGKGADGRTTSAPRDGVTTREVLASALDIKAENMTRDGESRVGTVLRQVLKMEARQHKENGVKFRRYWRTSDSPK